MNDKTNPFNWVRLVGYTVFLMFFGSYFENIFERSGAYLLALTVTTMVATKIILTAEEMILKDEP